VVQQSRNMGPTFVDLIATSLFLPLNQIICTVGVFYSHSSKLGKTLYLLFY
jgi:hypothetical protein